MVETSKNQVVLITAYRSIHNVMYKLCNLHFYVFTFWFDTEKALFQVILGLLLISISVRVCRLRERGRMSKSVYVRVVHDLELLRHVLRCSIERQL